MDITWTPVQRQRLKELRSTEEHQNMSFTSSTERDRVFQKIERLLVNRGKHRLAELRNGCRRPALCKLESKLIEALTMHGFVQVATPIMLAKGLLDKMTIDDWHPLYSQVFWIDDSRCLRPMLAPNLYYLLKDLVRIWEKPVRIFEVGSCFRKDSQGTHHLNEFTMLNLVELGLPTEGRRQRIEDLAALVMETAGVRHYQLQSARSEVYGDTIDVISGVEVASGAMGPHPLDNNWGIIDPWVGIGFGLERLVMVSEGGRNVQKVGKSLSYLDSVRLNI